MNFKEEFKSAMNKISPDEKTALRIEQAVLQKDQPAKKKKPFYVYAGAFSGAAACIVGAILLINFNINPPKNNLVSENCAGAGAAEESESTPQYLTASSSAAARDDILTADGVQDSDQLVEPADPGETFDSSFNAKNEVGLDMATEESAKSSYTLEFQPDESVIVFDGKAKMKFISDDTVVHYSKEPQDFISAKTPDGKRVLIILESNYLYIFKDDLKTADVYKLSN